MSTLCLFALLQEHYQCFLREDVCLIISRNTVPRAIFSSTPPREQGVYGYYGHMIIALPIAPVASKYEEIYPYSAMNMGSVKIHTSLIIMRESLIH